MTTVRPPAVAGMFYPANPKTLSMEIDRMLDAASPHHSSGSITAIVVPHAGYVYSGNAAATAYATLRGLSFETVVIVAPSHREYFKGISIFNGTAYRTPLGDMSVDESLRKEILKKDRCIAASSLGHGPEHAVEVQLPFLQRIFGDIKILPIVMGDQRREFCFHLAEKLSIALEHRHVLLIASSDLSHYHSYEEAERLDHIIIEDVSNFDYEKMMGDLETDRAEACGGGPAVAVLATAKNLHATKVEILSHYNSGDVTGDRQAVVGYLSAAVFRSN